VVLKPGCCSGRAVTGPCHTEPVTVEPDAHSRNHGRVRSRSSMLIAWLALFSAALRGAGPLAVVPVKTDPEKLAHSFLVQPPPPYSDCDTSVLQACPGGGFNDATDVTLRWVQLGEDPDLEAILITGPLLSPSVYVAYVFDRQGSAWNEIGSFMCSRQCDANELIRVQNLTDASPPLVLFYRDLGGSSSTILTTTAYCLYAGKLWPALEVTNFKWFGLPPPERTEHSTVLASKDRLVLHRSFQKRGGRVGNTCEVRRWDEMGHEFVLAPADRSEYCDVKTGKPIPGKSHSTGLPVVP
jgi:hypothetical protein